MFIAKLFFGAFLVYVAMAEVPWMVRVKRDIDQPMQCPASPIELSETQWNILSGILVNLQTRSKRSTDPGDIATILPNNEICFAGHKLIFKVPSDLKEAEKVREALNTFILMMSHLHGGHSGYYKTI